MSKAALFDLIHRLHKQYPVDTVTTWSACPQCGRHARGGDLCADCLVEEIAAVTGDAYRADRYRTQLSLQQTYLQSMIEAVERNGKDR